MNGYLQFLDFVDRKPLLFFILGLLILIVSLFLLGVPQSIASNDWPTTEGVVISSKVHEECCNSYTEGWYAQVSYRYSVNQHEYISDKIQFVDTGSANSDYYARETTKKYPVGKKVMVYFNPENPAQAILEPGPAALQIIAVFMLMMIGVSAVLVRLLGMLINRLGRTR